MAGISDAERTDLTLVGVVHAALRRDLVRARLVVAGDENADPLRRRALGEHLLWLVELIEDHLRDDDLRHLQLVRHDPARRPLVAELAGEHRSVSEIGRLLAASAAEYRDGADGSGSDLLAVLAVLETVLVAHLEREEAEVLPLLVGCAALPDGPAAPRVGTGLVGHWLLDGAPDDPHPDGATSLLRSWSSFAHRRAYARRYRDLWSGTRAVEVPALTVASYADWA